MYFSDAVRTTIRHWWIAVTGSVLVASGNFAVLNLVQTQHQATAQILLLPPSAPIQTGEPTNPYTNLPDGLTFTASLVAGSVATKDTERELKADGFDSEYVVSVVPGTGPLIVISVKDSDPEAVLKMRDRLMVEVETRVASIQAAEGVPDANQIGTRQFSVTERAEVLAGAKLRAIVLLSAVGMVATLLAIFGFDRAKAGRRAPTLSDQAVASLSLVGHLEQSETTSPRWPPPAPPARTGT